MDSLISFGSGFEQDNFVMAPSNTNPFDVFPNNYILASSGGDVAAASGLKSMESVQPEPQMGLEMPSLSPEGPLYTPAHPSQPSLVDELLAVSEPPLNYTPMSGHMPSTSSSSSSLPPSATSPSLSGELMPLYTSHGLGVDALSLGVDPHDVSNMSLGSTVEDVNGNSISASVGKSGKPNVGMSNTNGHGVSSNGSRVEASFGDMYIARDPHRTCVGVNKTVKDEQGDGEVTLSTDVMCVEDDTAMLMGAAALTATAIIVAPPLSVAAPEIVSGLTSIGVGVGVGLHASDLPPSSSPPSSSLPPSI